MKLCLTFVSNFTKTVGCCADVVGQCVVVVHLVVEVGNAGKGKKCITYDHIIWSFILLYDHTYYMIIYASIKFRLTLGSLQDQWDGVGMSRWYSSVGGEDLQKMRILISSRRTADKWRFSFHGEKKVGNDENLKKQVMTRMSWVVRPAHSWTPTMPKMKKTKKQRRRTLPSMGRVSNNSITKILMPFFWETNVNLLLTPSGALYTTVRHYRSPKTSLSPML